MIADMLLDFRRISTNDVRLHKYNYIRCNTFSLNYSLEQLTSQLLNKHFNFQVVKLVIANYTTNCLKEAGVAEGKYRRHLLKM